MKICIINPVITTSWEADTQQEYSSFARSGTQVKTVSLDWGPASVETRRDDALATPDILNKTIQAEKDGFDAVIIDCMADPGLFSAREVVSIPVVGPVEASMHLAAMLAHRFSIISLLDADRVSCEELAERYGLLGRLASIRPINVAVLDIRSNLDGVFHAILDASKKAILEDGAHLLIPGCNLLACLTSQVQSDLEEQGLAITFLNPRAVALKLAEALVDLHLVHSRVSYPPSLPKSVIWPVPTNFST